MNTRLGSMLILLGALGSASTARADGTIHVRVVDSAGRPADGRVILKGPKTVTCTTVGSRCTVKAPAGAYQALVEPRRDKAPPPKSVTVGDAASATLVIELLPAEGSSQQKSAALADDELAKIRKDPPGKNLAQGKKDAMKGRVVDAAGRPADALIVLTPDGGSAPIGHIMSVAGRFTLRDVPAGKYDVQVFSRRGGPPTSQRIAVTKQLGQVIIHVE